MFRSLPAQNFSCETPKVMASILEGQLSTEIRFQGQGMAEESSKKLTWGPIQLDVESHIEYSIENFSERPICGLGKGGINRWQPSILVSNQFAIQQPAFE